MNIKSHKCIDKKKKKKKTKENDEEDRFLIRRLHSVIIVHACVRLTTKSEKKNNVLHN